MTDRVHPNTAAAATANGAPAPKPAPFPATKSQLYGASRPAYRPQPHHRRRRSRSCCCSVCLWLSLIIILLIFLVAIASAVVYLIYRPQRPSFTVSAMKLSYFNITSSSLLNSKFDVNVTARNPNKKLVFTYNPVSISVFSKEIDVGDGLLPGFVHETKNTTLLKTSIISSRQQLDSSSESTLKSAMKSKKGLPLAIQLDTKVKLKMGALKSPKIGIRVSCDGISVSVPTGKSPATATTSGAKCKVDLRIKIWKWTI
ncbi:NDR1/HIN1-like protein 13 [Momordica charantia]|uniref:NDR1/HIN1-like protein 13 n=1 Tax=Momordica charantia TaxID=3673 RepID=A0A6J1D467_MOMCH|nr:NDR1/HIN1-like protein 13 [Momordica charantia]